MLTICTTLIFAGAFAVAVYAIVATLVPELARIADVLRGAELAVRVPITEPRRGRVRVQVAPAAPRSTWREAA